MLERNDSEIISTGEASTRERLVFEASQISRNEHIHHEASPNHGERIARIASISKARLKIRELAGEKSVLTTEEVSELKSQIETKEQEETHNGVNFSRIQIGIDIAKER